MVRRLRSGVWLLELGFVPPLGANAYLVDEAALSGEREGLTLVDTGFRRNSPSILDELGGLGHGPADLDRVLLTHYDLDHVGGLHRLAPAFDGPVYLGAADLALLRGEADPELVHHKGLFHRVVREALPLPDVDCYPLADGDTVGGFTAYETPGHNPGHLIYHHDAASTAFLGDLVWAEDGALTTPFWGDSYDMGELRASVRALAPRLPAFDVAAMGHGDPLTADGSAALQALADRC